MTEYTPVIHWFRRDLRLSDNLALKTAAKSGFPVLPLFVLDARIVESEKVSAPRMAWLLQSLEALDRELRRYGSCLHVFYGDPKQVIKRLIQQTHAQGLYYNKDYTPFALKRDEVVSQGLDVPTYAFDDGVLLIPGQVMNKAGNPFTVFTPFKKKWMTFEKSEIISAPKGDCFLKVEVFSSTKLMKGQGDKTRYFERVPDLKDLGFEEVFALPKAGEKAARKRLSMFLDERVYQYSKGRNVLAALSDDDTLCGSSFLSPYLRFGTLSARQAYWGAQERYDEVEGSKSKQHSVDAWIGELVWRDFYMHILYHFPHVVKTNFRTQYDGLEWRRSKKDIEAWKAGMTGYPVVDAAMRQLQAMGWMPNRARMVVASFLTKDLLIDWRQGERHFMDWLIDGDPAANNGGWQWSASTGTDAQPFFRIFSPVLQSKRFDPDGVYIRRWIPELRDVNGRYIHTPWKMSQQPKGYPKPIVDHQLARQQTLDAFRARKKS